MALGLSLLVFTTGLVTLGVEFSASRLLEPAFGNSQLVWAALIGLILLSLAVGAWLGGRLADRYPRRRELDLVLTAAAVAVALVPLLSAPALHLAATGMADLAPGLLAGALLAVTLLFAVPAVLLGTATPWAVRLAVTDVQHTGHIAGRFSAIATAGSLVGAFLPVLWLIPTFGTRWTFYLLALSAPRRLAWVRCAARTAGCRWVRWCSCCCWPSSPSRPACGQRGMMGAAASSSTRMKAPSTTSRVRQWGSERHLKLNDGIGIHSVYHPDALLSSGIWDYFLLAPLFRPEPPKNLLLIGAAAGTVGGLYTDIYGPLPITGVELDPQILQVGREYLSRRLAQLHDRGRRRPALSRAAGPGHDLRRDRRRRLPAALYSLSADDGRVLPPGPRPSER